MNRDEKELMIYNLTDQLAVEKELYRGKEEQLRALEEEFHTLTKRFEAMKTQRTKVMVALKNAGGYTVNEIAELFGMDKAEVFDILINN